MVTTRVVTRYEREASSKSVILSVVLFVLSQMNQKKGVGSRTYVSESECQSSHYLIVSIVSAWELMGQTWTNDCVLHH